MCENWSQTTMKDWGTYVLGRSTQQQQWPWKWPSCCSLAYLYRCLLKLQWSECSHVAQILEFKEEAKSLFSASKAVSVVRRDLEISLPLFLLSSQMTTLISSDREKYLKHYLKTLCSSLKKTTNSSILFCMSDWISWKRQAKSTIQPFWFSRSFVINVQTFTVSKTETCHSQPPRFFMPCSEHKICNFMC